MNMMSSFIDLKVAAIANKVRVLLLLFDDKKYGNVALGDIALFNEYTSITSTVDLLSQFDMVQVLESVHPIQLKLDYDPTVIEDFKNSSEGYTEPGVYVMKMEGITSPFLGNQ